MKNVFSSSFSSVTVLYYTHYPRLQSILIRNGQNLRKRSPKPSLLDRSVRASCWSTTAETPFWHTFSYTETYSYRGPETEPLKVFGVHNVKLEIYCYSQLKEHIQNVERRIASTEVCIFRAYGASRYVRASIGYQITTEGVQ